MCSQDTLSIIIFSFCWHVLIYQQWFPSETQEQCSCFCQSKSPKALIYIHCFLMLVEQPCTVNRLEKTPHRSPVNSMFSPLGEVSLPFLKSQRAHGQNSLQHTFWKVQPAKEGSKGWISLIPGEFTDRIGTKSVWHNETFKVLFKWFNIPSPTWGTVLLLLLIRPPLDFWTGTRKQVFLFLDVVACGSMPLAYKGKKEKSLALK